MRWRKIYSTQFLSWFSFCEEKKRHLEDEPKGLGVEETVWFPLEREQERGREARRRKREKGETLGEGCGR